MTKWTAPERQLKTYYQWVSVKDKLPVINERCLIFLHNRHMVDVRYKGVDKKKEIHTFTIQLSGKNINCRLTDITYWTTLMEPNNYSHPCSECDSAETPTNAFTYFYGYHGCTAIADALERHKPQLFNKSSGSFIDYLCEDCVNKERDKLHRLPRELIA